MKLLVMALASGLCVSMAAQNPTVAPAQCRTDLKIDEFLLPDDASAAKIAFASFRSALLSGDRQQVLAQILFPADFVVEGSGMKFESDRELASQYNRVFTHFVVDSVKKQKVDGLLAGWDGVTLPNGAITFTRDESGAFRVTNVKTKPVQMPKSVQASFKERPTCPPVVIDGEVVAYDWASHMMPGFEGIYIDHMIVHVTKVDQGNLPHDRIRADF